MPVYPYALTITNPGAETGDTTGWTDDQGVLEAVTTSGGTTPRTGSYFFYAGPYNLTECHQNIAVPMDAQADVDAGNLYVRATGYHAGFSDSDKGLIAYWFLDGSGRRLMRHVHGAFAHDGVNAWTERTLESFVPPGTRTIQLQMFGSRESGTQCDSYWDDLSVELYEPTDVVRQTGTGLVYNDDFQYKNAALTSPWTVLSGGSNWQQTDSLEPSFFSWLQCEPTSTLEECIYTDHDAVGEMVVQSQMDAALSSTHPGLFARMDATAQNGYYVLHVGSGGGRGIYLFKRVSGVDTQLAFEAYGVNHVAEMMEFKGIFRDGEQKIYLDGSLVIDEADTTFDGDSGYSGYLSNRSGLGTRRTRYDEFRIMDGSNAVTVTGLPTGYKVQVNGPIVDGGADQTFGPVTESGGTATVECGAAWWPATSIEVLDAGDVVIATYAPGHIYSGDSFAFDQATDAPLLSVEFGDDWAQLSIRAIVPEGETHSSTTWQITTADDTTFASPVELNTTSAVFLYEILAETLTASTAYIARARFTTSISGASEYSDVVPFTTRAAQTKGDTPSLTLEDKNVDYIEVSVPAYNHSAGETEPPMDPENPAPFLAHTRFQIRLASDPDWTTPLATEVVPYTGLASSLETIFEGLTVSTPYKLRAKQLDGYLAAYTAWSLDLNVTTNATPAATPNQPTLTIVACGRSISVTGSAFSHGTTGVHTRSQWALCSGSACETIKSGDPEDLTAFTWEEVPPGTYTLKVRYADEMERWGPYSSVGAPQTCTVDDYPPVVVFTNPAIGSVISTSQTVQWEAYDPESVGFTFDGELQTVVGGAFSAIFTDQVSASYLFPITGRNNGPYLIRVRSRNPGTDETGEWAYLPLRIDRTGARAVHYHFADFEGTEFPSTWRKIWSQVPDWGFLDTYDPFTDTTYRVGLFAQNDNNIGFAAQLRRSGLVFDEFGEPDEFDITATFELIPKECQGIGWRFTNFDPTRGGVLTFGTAGDTTTRTGMLSVMDWGEAWYLGPSMACATDGLHAASGPFTSKYAMQSGNTAKSWIYGRGYYPADLRIVVTRTNSPATFEVSSSLGSSTSPRIGSAFVYTDEFQVLGNRRKLYTLKQSVRRGVNEGNVGWFITTQILGPGIAFSDGHEMFLREVDDSGRRIVCGACGLGFQDLDVIGVGRAEGVLFTDFSIAVHSYGSCEPAAESVEVGCEADWRFTMFERDDVTPWYGTADEDGNVVEADFYDNRACPRPYLLIPKNFSETEINFPEGKSTIGQITVQVADKRLTEDQATGIVTARIGEAKGCRGVLERWREDLGYVTVFDGVVESVQLDPSVSSYSFHLRDPRERERDVEMFTRNETFALWPTSGPIASYGQLPNDLGYLLTPAQPQDAVSFSLAGTVGDITYGYIQLAGSDGDNYLEDTVYPWGFPEYVGQPAVGISGALFGSSTVGYYRHTGITVRWRPSAGGDWVYLRDMPSVSGGNAIIKPDIDLVLLGGWRLYMGAFDAADLPDDSDLIDVQILAAKTTEKTPYFWDLGTFGTLLLAAYDGDFSEQVPNIRFNRERLEEWAEQTPNARFIARAVEPSLRKWVEKNVYGAIGWAPSFDADMRIVPVEWELPPADEELVELDADWLIPVGDFSDSSESIVNHVRYTYIKESVVPIDGGFGTLLHQAVNSDALRTLYGLAEWTRLVEDPVTRQYIYEPTLDIKEGKLDYEPVTVRSTGTLGEAILAVIGVQTADAIADKIGNTVIYRFGEGAAEFDVEVRAGMAHGPGFDPYTLDVVAGQWVKVRAMWVPDYLTGERGAFRYMQLKGISDQDIARRRFRMIDGGPVVEESATGESDDPSVLPFLQPPDIDYLTETEDLRVEVTVEFPPDAPDGYRARVDFAVGLVEPAADSGEWTLVGYLTESGTITTSILPAGETVWVRARGEAPGRRPSAWTPSETILLSDKPGLLLFELSIDEDGLVTATWTPNDFAEGLRFETSAGAIGHTASFSTYDDVDSDSPLELALTGEEIGYDEELYVRVTAYPGFSLGSVTGTAGAVYTLRIPRPAPSTAATHEWGAHSDTDFIPPEDRVDNMTGLWDTYDQKFHLGEVAVFPVDLASADVTGVLPANNGGTGLSNADLSGDVGKVIVVNATADGFIFEDHYTKTETDTAIAALLPIDLTTDVTGELPTANGGAPAGGTTGQVLKKQSNTDFDYDWDTDATGSGGYSEGTGFPGSPSNDDKFFRTDRDILYYYDSTATAWLSVEIFEHSISFTSGATAATTAFYSSNPWWNVYDIWVVEFGVRSLSTTTTAANYFTHQFIKADAGGETNVGSAISGQSNTQNQWVGQTTAIGASITATHEVLLVRSTETGTSSTFMVHSITYRLIG